MTTSHNTPFTFYWGAASGSARAALRRLEEPNVMINYATKLNEPWDGIENLFIDCGGYSFIKGKGEYQTSHSAYLDYIERVNPQMFALRDYPCERDVLREHGHTVEDHQRMTWQAHLGLANRLDDRDIDAAPMTVLQGRYTQDYLEHLETMRDHGLLYEHVGIGTLCGREKDGQIRKIVTGVRDALGDGHRLHAFGVKLSALRDRQTLQALDSADSNAYDTDERKVRTRGGDPYGRQWQDVAYYYLKHKRKLRRRVRAVEGLDPSELRDSGQSGLEELA